MRLPLPRSLSGQTFAIVILGLAVSHIVAIALYSFEREDVVTSTEGIDFADRVVGSVRLLQRLPIHWRQDVVRESDGRTFHVMLGPTPEAAKWDRDSGRVRRVANYLQSQLPDWSADRFVVSYTDRRSTPEKAISKSEGIRKIMETPDFPNDDLSHDFLHISLRLDNSAWLNFVGAIPQPATSGLVWAGLYILFVAFIVGAIAIWLVSRAIGPLTAFARAAERLGKNIRAEPLPEDGPREVAQAARAFNSMQERLRRLVENRTQILAAVSHDLRTPVTLLRLRAELMEDAENQAKVLRTLDEMELMIASVLDFTKATFHDEPQRQVDLAALVGSICDDRSDAGHRIEFESPGRLPYICRRMELKRALTNLIDNAIKYGGCAMVAIEQRPGSIDIVIDDEGPGIPEDQMDMIFMPFYRTDPSRQRGGGVGLGLSIAQTIVHGHGGRIELENLAEGGLRARVSLPT